MICDGMMIMERIEIDLKENQLNRLNRDILAILLKDHSSGKNIIWATDNYSHKGIGFQKHDTIEVSAITGYNGNTVKPRITKSKKEQTERIRQKAEVFTPTWICNKQNNLVDNAWFGLDVVFNTEDGTVKSRSSVSSGFKKGSLFYGGGNLMAITEFDTEVTFSLLALNGDAVWSGMRRTKGEIKYFYTSDGYLLQFTDNWLLSVSRPLKYNLETNLSSGFIERPRAYGSYSENEEDIKQSGAVFKQELIARFL